MRSSIPRVLPNYCCIQVY